ncbi:aminopeptidase P N-terminal domain-containing protein [Sulfurimonas sp. C5]|uniref:aminopeptidase P N-terminal domain-containing protein n=1 Tax=Sulfurimonas sp. C5 TaxID=3036947 RepID=UPI0024561D30|nr:aminopeptidase P N-terminal domain-containing protein [Sulfurimonas sp. C5]MDH4944962.1 aminopeptidase P N-terminal domain-containing protein [Sulfurimonas sp. C5]
MIKEKEYKGRREKFAKKLQSDSVAIFCAAEQKVRSNDTEYPYRQDSNFYYLTGFKEDNSTLVFVKKNTTYKIYLFVEKKDPVKELWTGKRLGAEKAKELFDVDDVFEIEHFAPKLQEFLEEKNKLYYDFKVKNKLLDQVKLLAKNILYYKDAAKTVETMRLIKSTNEIKLIQKALEITKEAHHKAIQMSQKLSFEYELQAEIEYIFKKNGAYSDAYTSIVASGDNANTLHYIDNNMALNKGDLILIDAGCEYEYYSSDITRTIPVSGKFTKAQKELYQMVLDVEKKIISMMKPNILRSELQNEAEKMLCEGMVKLGILKGSVKKLLKDKVHKKYFPHGIGHYMGLDVHDQNPYKNQKNKEIPLKAGMILTIEPGIYLPEDDKKIPKKYRGIGIRIEDDILVTKEGYENLSKEILKEIKDIESYSSL